MAEEQVKLKNENIEVELDCGENCQVSMNVSVSASATKASWQDAMRSVKKQVSLPGFRKGKAPDALILRQFSKPLQQEWHEKLLNTSFSEACELSGRYCLHSSSLKNAKVKRCEKEEGADLFFEFESYPLIPDLEDKPFVLKSVEARQIEEANIDDEITHLAKSKVEWKEIKDRVAEEGDFVQSTLYEIKEEEKILFEKRALELQEGKIEPWLKELLLGMEAGQEKEGLDDKGQKHRIVAHSLHQAVLPSIDDEFAKSFGLKDLEDLRDKIKERLEDQEKQRVKELLRMQVEESLLERYHFDLPQSLLTAEKKSLKNARLAQLKKEGKKEEQLSAEEENIEKETQEQADKKLRLIFLIRAFAEKERIEVSQKVIEEKIMEHQIYASMANRPKMTNEEQQQLYSYFANLLTEEAVKDALLEKATLEA